MRRTTLRRLAPTACALALAGISASASAQDQQQNAASPPLALDRFYPAPPGDRMFGVQSPYAPGDMTLHVSVVADYAHNPLVLRTVGSGEDVGAIVSDQLFLHLNAGFSFKHRVFISASFPIALYQNGSSPTGNGIDFASPTEADIGDLRLGLRFRLLGDYWDPFQLALGGYLWFPTGNSLNGSFVSDGTFRGLPQVIFGGRIAERVVWAFNAGPDIRGSQVFGGDGGTTQSMMMRLDGGVGFLLDSARNFQIGLEANAAFNLDNLTDDPVARSTNLELLAGARYRFLHDFEIGAGAGPGLTSGIGTPDVRVIGMLAYTPEIKKPEPVKDTDGDGILDPMDACVTVKGLPSTDPKTHGCPDTDGDTFRDPLDACPTVPGLANADPKLNGCADTDGDGIFDAQDACPQVKGVPNADPKLHGCPPDSDGDGIADAEDACPTVKGVPNADPKLNGCPPDKDGDGIIDSEDACPDVKGIKTADPATNGCPGDTDGDTIRDDKDACPNEKGKPDPDPTKNGCPTAVRVTETEVIILQQVQFDTNKATIKKVSDPLLNEVAEVLREHPELLRLEVQGHTDSKGSPALNKTLSQNRAESVKKALIKRGIADGRLVPKGYGQDKPIADNNTDEGRQKNRRVQFVILERTTKDKLPQANPPGTAPKTTQAPATTGTTGGAAAGASTGGTAAPATTAAPGTTAAPATTAAPGTTAAPATTAQPKAPAPKATPKAPAPKK